MNTQRWHAVMQAEDLSRRDGEEPSPLLEVSRQTVREGTEAERGSEGGPLLTVQQVAELLAVSSRIEVKPPRITLRIEEASKALGMSVDSFERHVRPEIRTIRRGRMVLVPVSELEDWVEREGHCVARAW